MPEPENVSESAFAEEFDTFVNDDLPYVLTILESFGFDRLDATGNYDLAQRVAMRKRCRRNQLEFLVRQVERLKREAVEKCPVVDITESCRKTNFRQVLTVLKSALSDVDDPFRNHHRFEV